MHIQQAATSVPTHLLIEGGTRLQGTVAISGRKNSISGLMAACMLADGPTTLENVPDIRETGLWREMLEFLGAHVDWVGPGRLRINPDNIMPRPVPMELAGQLRSGYYLLGVLLARFGLAKVALPGGDQIGPRPVDQHVKGLRALNAKVIIQHGQMIAKGKELQGGNCRLDFISVGATIHLMLTAATLHGTTTIHPAAREPHVVDIATLLGQMGCHVVGAGTDTIRITGTGGLLKGGQTHRVIPDDLEAATFLAAAGITGGDVRVTNLEPEHLTSIVDKLRECEFDVTVTDEEIHVVATDRPKAVHIRTVEYPGFQTDAQSQFTTMLTLGRGTSRIEETIYTDRFKFAPGLEAMGARVFVSSQVAVVDGVERLKGAHVEGHDIRAVAALVLAGMAAEGNSSVGGVNHLVRGYENLVGKLQSLGAKVQWA